MHCEVRRQLQRGSALHERAKGNDISYIHYTSLSAARSFHDNRQREGISQPKFLDMEIFV